MYIKKTKKQISLLQIDENFATLVETGDDSGLPFAKFLFSFKISKLEAINKNAFSVLVTLKKPNVASEPKIVYPLRDGQIDILNSNKIIKNILNHKLRITNANKNKADLVITSKVGDISSKIDNQLVIAARNNSVESTNFVSLQKPSLVVKSTKEKELTGDKSLPLIPMMSVLENFENVDVQQRNLRLHLLKKSHISPSRIADISDRTISVHSSFSGTSRLTNPDRNNNSLNLLLSSHTKDLNENLGLHEITIGKFFNDIVTIDVPITINDFFEVASTNLVVSFELLTNSTYKGVTQTSVLEKVEKSINLLKLYEDISNSKKPDIGFTTNDTKVTVLVKKQKNIRSNSQNKINIYKRDLNLDTNSNYELVESNEFSDATVDGMLFSFSNNKDNSIYRINIDGQAEFYDFVTKNQFANVPRKVITVPYLYDNKIAVRINDVNNCLFDVAAIKILYRNVSLKEKRFTINEIFTYSSESKFVCESIISSNLIPYHIYEITVQLILKNGVEAPSNSSSFIEFYPKMATIPLDVSPTVTNDDVTFTLNANLLNEQNEILKTLLEQSSGKYNVRDIENRYIEFDKFIAFNVLRYNLTTGELDDLGIIPNFGIFSDSEMSKKSSVVQVTQGNSYVYVINPLVRTPLDVINENSKIKDRETRKEYLKNIRKHHHPLTLNRGSTVSHDILNSDIKQDMMYGKTGTSFLVTVSIPKNKPSIENIKVSFLDKKRLILKWMISGETSLIDHFIIMKEINGVKSVIGKSHAFLKNLSFIHELSMEDLGNIRFLLCPIYEDFSSGSDLGSNYILINSL